MTKNKIRKIFHNDDNKKLLKNFSYLSILQIANYAFPLITFPYLVRVLGPEKFGLIAFANAFIMYFNILTSYGFDLSATKDISINRENKLKVNQIFSAVMIIKIVFLLISLSILSIIIILFSKFSKDIWLYYLTFGTVIGRALFPVWLFQGLEEMKFITIINILARFIYTLLIFVFVRNMNDYLYVPAVNSAGLIIAGILALFIVRRRFSIKLTLVSFESIKWQLKEGWYIFISTVSISFYTVSNIFILGLFTNNTIVGYYAGAEKIVNIIKNLYAPISQTIYPHLNKLFNENKERGLQFSRNILKIVAPVSLFIVILLIVFANIIVNIVLGMKYTNSVVILRILSFLPFFIVLSNIMGIQVMLSLNYKEAFTKIVTFSSVLNVVLATILVQWFAATGIAISVFLSELFVTLLMYMFLNTKGIYLIKGNYV